MKIKGIVEALKLSLKDTGSPSINVAEDMILITVDSLGTVQLKTKEEIRNILETIKFGEDIDNSDWFINNPPENRENREMHEVKNDDITDTTIQVPQSFKKDQLIIWDKLEEKWIIVGAGGGGGSDILIYNQTNNEPISQTPLTKLRVVGNNIEVRNGTELGEAVIYSPKLQYVNNFSITNSVPLTPRYISRPTSEGDPFKIGNWSPGSSHGATESNSFTYTSNNPFSCKTNNTSLQVIIYDANGVDVLFNNSVTINGNNSYNFGSVIININNFGPDFDQYKAYATISINWNTLLSGKSGRFSVKIVHHNAGTDYTFMQNDIFYDAKTLTSDISGLTITENSPILKYCSGVAGYNNGSSFTINIDDIDNINSDSYPNPIISINGSNYYLNPTILNLSGNDLTNWSNLWDNSNSSYSKNNWPINTTNIYVKTETAKISASVLDWSTIKTIYSSDSPIIINTLTETSTRRYTNFKDEKYRLKSDLSPWDSTQNLLLYDDNLGLQVENGFLKYPFENYSVYNPHYGLQPDYSTANGNRTYYTVFWKENFTNVSGIIKILGNITQSDLDNRYVELWLSLDGISWYDATVLYNFDDDLQDGDGCRVDNLEYALNINNKIRFTLANLGTSANTGRTEANGNIGWGIFIKIIIKADHPSINLTELSIEENWA